MNEININIEGYNVNGVCIGCLNYNRKMFALSELKEVYQKLANIEIPDGANIQVCWECASAIRNIKRFQIQIQDSFNILLPYSRKHTYLESHTDLSKHAKKRLEIVFLNEIDLDVKGELANKLETKNVEDKVDLTLVKEENNFKLEDIDIVNHFDDKTDLKLENDIINDNSDTENYDTINFNQPLSDEDDDIILSKIKKKKSKKKKEKKKPKIKLPLRTKDSKERRALQLKNYRKLKNLPEDLVELWEMTETEMLETRARDLASKYFEKLKYKCDKCIAGFNTEKLKMDHMNGKHNPKDPSNDTHCDICKTYFLSADNLTVHRSLHLTGYKCACGFISAVKSIIMRHIKDVHRVRDEKDIFSCNLCEKSFNTKSKLNYHKGISHQLRPQCDCCGKIFANKMTLKYHLKILPNDKTDTKPKEKLYLPCKGCGKVFYSRKSYRAHVVIHEGLEYPCSICGKLFQWKRNLARHIRNHREKDTGTFYDCAECGKRFSSKDCYNNHMKFSKKHVSEESYTHECSYCGKKFATKWCLIDHVDWDHLKKIKYQCPVCMKAFKTAKIMVAHQNNIHEGKKNREPEGEHLCEICGKSYKTVKRLKGHVWSMHTHRSTAKSFKCKLCPATFTWQTSIYKHMKMMHENPRKTAKTTRPVPSIKKIREDRAAPVAYDTLEIGRMQFFTHRTQEHNPSLNILQNNI